MDLIERMRAVSARTNDPLLSEAAAALEAAREDANDAARWRFVRTLGKLPVRCSSGYYYEDVVLHPTLNEAIDQARGKAGGEA